MTFVTRIGNFAARHSVWIVLGWLALALIIFLVAPPLSKVSVTEESQFLPHGAESVVARDVLQQKFPGGIPPGSAILVLYNPQGWYQNSELDTQYSGYVDELTQWLDPQTGQAPEAVKQAVSQVMSVSSNPELKDYLVSTDNTTMLINIELSVSSFSHEAENAVKAIRKQLASHPEGLEVYATGEAPISADLLDSVQRSVTRTTIVTIILVVVMLFIIYRSPVASLVPLATIGISYLIARGILGFMADGGFKVSNMVEAYMVVIVFGVGTDYCMFIISRFREDMARENSSQSAVFKTMYKMGPVIAASATTVVIGFLALMISHFGMDKTLGPSIAIAVVITLLVGVTLTPALMTLLGRRLFWLGRVQTKKSTGRFSWDTIGKIVARHPLLVAPPLIILLLLPYIALPNLSRTSDMVTAMRKSADSIRGYNVMSEHFGAGQLSPTTVVLVSSRSDILQANSLRAQEQAAQTIRELPGVDQVRTALRPLGGQPVSDLLVGNQLQNWSTGLETAASQLGSNMDSAQIAQLQLLPDYFTALSNQYPEVTRESTFVAVQDNIQKLEALVTQVTSGNVSEEALNQIKVLLKDLSENIAGLASQFAGRQDAYFIPQSLLDSSSALKDYISGYYSPDGTTVKFEIILNYQPYTNQALDTIKGIRNSLKSSLAGTDLSDGQYYVAGATAERADIMNINSTDFIRVMILTLVGVYVIVSLLLRSMVAPIYMVLTVVLNFGAALGISSWAFNNIFHYSGINYMVPSILFVVLVAVGADYNIFLVSRIREESKNASSREAVHIAVSNTGGVITACGMILAGTFAALTSAPFQIVLQIGVAVSVGVILDTFLVRAILVPSIASFVGKWNWWPIMKK
jgi:putative drug exporter of the RND superfamily